jgi:hypothetical protein
MNAGCWFVNVVNKYVYSMHIIIIVSFTYLLDLHCWSSDLKNFTVPYKSNLNSVFFWMRKPSHT